MVGVLACPNIYCVSRTYSKPQPVIQVNVQTSLYLTHLKAGCRSLHCPNTSLVSPGLTPNLSLSRYSQCSSPGRLSEPSLSKHLTCVSRTYSQPQPVAILSMFISRQVVGAFTVQTPHLCLQDLLPTSACRDTPSIPKTCHLRQPIDKSLSTNDLTVNMPKSETKTRLI